MEDDEDEDEEEGKYQSGYCIVFYCVGLGVGGWCAFHTLAQTLALAVAPGLAAAFEPLRSVNRRVS